MKKSKTRLETIFDETLSSKIVFVRKDGKLAMVRKQTSVAYQPIKQKPLFPINRERK